QPVEIAAVTQFLLKTSEAFEAKGPAEGYQPDAERGKTLFSQKGCMACHSNSAFDDLNPDFGPNLDKFHAKLAAGEAGFNWLYTWIKEPTHYHKRTKMPDLYLDPYKEGEATIDPAADIAAWLLQKGPQEWPEIEVDEQALDELVALFLEKKVLKSDQFKQFMETRDLSLGGTLSQDSLKGDEVELWTDPGTTVDDAQWKQIRLNFVGRRTVSRYGCYGCHDIPGFEEARPIGVALQDWGRKDRSKLAPEHIHEFLHSHAVEYLVVPLAESENAEEILAEIDGPIAFREWVEGRDESLPAAITETLNHGDYGKTIGDFAEHHHLKVGEWTKEPYEFNGQKFLILVESSHSFEEEVKEYLHQAETDSFASEADREHGLSVAYLYQNLLHHGRAGFAWQELRQPRSYDFEKISTKGYDERLRMPKFPFSHQQIEEVTTFLLGLVAEPPSEEYVYRPTGPAGDRIAGEQLLTKFNCTGCHVVDNPKYSFLAKLNDLPSGVSGEPIGSHDAMSLLDQISPPRRVSIPGHLTQFPFKVSGELSDVIDDLGETPEGWEEFINAHGTTAEERMKAMGYKGDSNPAEWEFYVTLWENLIVERQPLSGQIVHLGSEGTADSLTIKLTSDGSMNAVLTYSANETRLSAIVTGESEDDVLDVARIEMTIDLDDGIHKVTFEGPAAGTDLKAHTFQSAEIFRNVTSLRQIHGTISVKLPDAQITPSSRMGFVGADFSGYVPGRGGEFTRWLIDNIVETHPKVDKTDDGWNFVAPPLVGEGRKVQTPWLYRFLREPEKLRYLTVLRMPKFNMSSEEAQILANYFAASEAADYPYQPIPQQQPPYLAKKNAEFNEKYPEKRTDNYLSEAWQIMMEKGNVCIGCHSVAGRDYLSSAKP
ncbi:MAG TPA: cytochrome c, partial [Planctomycetaceae bacterium]|nr:cytochrome c [Planctomycetaceae bacterium]